MIQLINKIKTALHNSPSVCAICWTIKRIPQFVESAFMFGISCALLLMIAAFAGLMFDATIFNQHIPTLLYDWFGTGKDEDKHETLKFIGFGMGGVLATIGAIAFNRRANAQIEASKAQTKHNELIEKGYTNERFKSATENLGHASANVRTASYYQFYYLAKEEKEDFRHSVFEILCSCLHSMPPDKFHLTGEDRKPMTEFQALLNILFKSDDKSVFGEFQADLRKSYLVGMDLSDAHLANARLRLADLSYTKLRRANFSSASLLRVVFSGAKLKQANLSDAKLRGADLSDADLMETDLQRTQLEDVNLMNVRSVEKANFCGAKIGDRPITKDDIPADKGEYYADWNPPPKKEEN